MKKFRWIAAFFLIAVLISGCSGSKKLADGTYQVELTLAGGTGRATVQSPAALEVRDGSMWLTLIWSSSNYDYMLVDGVKYEPVTYEGGSTFVLPVEKLGEIPVIADTVAMSTPHEVEYTLTLDANSVK